MHSDPVDRARRIGAEAGPLVARRLVTKADRDPSRRQTISADLEKEVMTRAGKYARAGWSKAMGLAWAESFMAAADPIIQAAFDAWEVEADAA